MNLGMEDEYTEHKRSTSELREGMESVASILNKHDHGTLYFGVRPSDGEVIGQDVSEKTLRDVSQAFTNRIEPRVSTRPSIAWRPRTARLTSGLRSREASALMPATAATASAAPTRTFR